MKLYTEEQVKDAFIRGVLKGMSGSTLSTYELFEMYISELTPIELPSDEDVKQHLTNKHSKALNPPSVYYRIGFKAGIKWMKEQILNQNK